MDLPRPEAARAFALSFHPPRVIRPPLCPGRDRRERAGPAGSDRP